jgi:transposase
MPWKECSVVDERLRFVARLLDGEPMAEVCRSFGISRKTGYKIFSRYREHGLEALSDRSRRPVRYANQLPPPIESLIVRFKGEKPHWGARKIRELLVRRLAEEVRIPARSTIHAVLDRHGLVKHGSGPRRRACGTPLSAGSVPNDLWCADFKGEFKLGNGRYCYPLTVTDHAARFLLMCEALESTREDLAFTAFERLFAERGLPVSIRSDNGVPFASPNALFNLSKLSVWWLRLGIAIELSYPFHDRDVLVTACGRLCLHGKKINISIALAGQRLGIKEVDDGIWLVSFMHYDLGYFDLEQRTLQPLDNPFGPKPIIDVSGTTPAL